MADLSEDDRWRQYLVDNDPVVLRNKLELTNVYDLDDYQYSLTAFRAEEIRLGIAKIEPTFDADHLKAIHGHLFQDVFEWSGQFRTVTLQKGDSAFVKPDKLESLADKIGAEVRATPWETMEIWEKHEVLARNYEMVNRLHPFREGSGRVTAIWMEAVAWEAGVDLDFSSMRRDTFIDAAIAAQDRRDLEPITSLIAEHSTDVGFPPPPRASSPIEPIPSSELVAPLRAMPDAGASLSERIDKLEQIRHPLVAPPTPAMPTLRRPPQLY